VSVLSQDIAFHWTLLLRFTRDMTAAVMISETVDPVLFSHEGPKSTGKLIVDEGGKEDRKDQRKKKAWIYFSREITDITLF
jgi:hypothetical protein